MQTGNQRLSKTVNSFVIGRKAKYFPIVNRSVYRPGFGSNLLPSGLTGGLKSPPEDLKKIMLIDFRQNYKLMLRRLVSKEPVTEIRVSHFHPKTGFLPVGDPGGGESRGCFPPPNYNSIIYLEKKSIKFEVS